MRSAIVLLFALVCAWQRRCFRSELLISLSHFDIAKKIFKYFYAQLSLSLVPAHADVSGDIFKKSGKALQNSQKYHLRVRARISQKREHIFIPRYGIKTADSTYVGVLFARCSRGNAISPRRKSLSAAKCNLFAYTRSRAEGKYFWFSSRIYLRISRPHTSFA